MIPLAIDLHLLDRIKGAGLDAGIAFDAFFRIDHERRLDDARDGLGVAGTRALAASAADARVDLEADAVIGKSTRLDRLAVKLAERAVPAQVILEFLGKVFDGRLQRVVGIAAQIAERRD